VALPSYAAVIVRNLRAVRARKGLEQRDLVERMRALGFTNWHRQTLSRIEQGQRNLLAGELLGLVVALEVTMPRLLEPQPDDKLAAFPDDKPLPVRYLQWLVWGEGTARSLIIWQGNVPVRREVTASWGNGDQPPEEDD
jgi:transcriptional regulator with XRE-family HTH domain